MISVKMVNKCVKFQFITDTRFGENKKKLIEMDRKLKKSGVNIIREGSIREIDWDAESYTGAKPSKQWRREYVVGKNSGTWNDVYGKVNKIKPVPYKKVSC